MPKIPQNQRFEPSSNVIKTWYGTRKESRQYNGVVLPGLFSTHNFAYDFFGFFLIVVLEVWGIVNLMVVGQFGFIMALPNMLGLRQLLKMWSDSPWILFLELPVGLATLIMPFYGASWTYRRAQSFVERFIPEDATPRRPMA